MDVWYEGTDLRLIEKMRELGLLSGVIVTPMLIAEAPIPPKKLIQNLLSVQNGWLAVQVEESTFEEIIEEAKQLYDYSTRVLVTIPATQDGMHAIHRLSHARIPTIASSITTPIQGLIAAKAGATYLANNNLSLSKTLGAMVKSYQFDCRPLLSCQSQEELATYIENGITSVCMQGGLIQQCLAILPTSEATLQRL